MARRVRLSTCLWYVFAPSMVICLLGNLVLFRSVFDAKSSDGQSKEDGIGYNLGSDGGPLSRLDSLSQVNEHSLRRLMGNEEGLRSPGEAVNYFESNKDLSLRIPVEIGRDMLGCSDLTDIRDVTYLDSGWTKAVYRGILNDRPIAIKTVDVSGQEVTTCIEKGFHLEECHQKATRKLLKEISLLQGLEHDNVIKVFGYCIPDKPYTGDADTVVTMVTELGQSVDIIRLLQMWWEDRLRVAYDMAKIIHFLSTSPYGSLSMNDFRRQQFVLVNGVLKLSDVDDMGMEEPLCSVDTECDQYFFNDNLTLKTPCSSGRCVGYNEKKNIFNAGRHFTTFLLPHGAPRTLRPLIDRTIDGFGNVTMTSEQLLQQMEKIVSIYRSGEYLNRTDAKDVNPTYSLYSNSDLPGQFDYRCKLALSGSGCTISVFDHKEAEEICNADQDCKGFVLTSELTWTGRKITHLKSGFSEPSRSEGMQLYVKQM